MTKQELIRSKALLAHHDLISFKAWLNELLPQTTNPDDWKKLIFYCDVLKADTLSLIKKEQGKTTKGKELFFTKDLAKGMFGCRTTASTLDCVDCPVSEHCKEVVDICHNAEGQPDAGVTIKLKEQEP